MVFLGGPRQVGKTTLALDLLGSGKTARYYNFDFDADRERISAGQ
jgi:predicted AAA+ superfamily ATPase